MSGAGGLSISHRLQVFAYVDEPHIKEFGQVGGHADFNCAIAHKQRIHHRKFHFLDLR